MAPVSVHRSVAGSYSSALASTVVPLNPPTTRTFPFGSSVVVDDVRLRFMDAAARQVPLDGW